ncbi:MAG: STM4012 family radical SAM protein [Candidatus Obscuribacterales bacterium]|nr:STM4012 family radical SAM protein [Candidatus Obscuribacterales bacterium]
MDTSLLEDDDGGERYTAYSYSYPHKTSYRKLAQPISLSDLWMREKRDSLFLYFHIPFCEMRCGFCNLFTTTNQSATLEAEYLDALERQALAVKESIGDSKFVRMALGGGTPTYLETRDLERLFDIAANVFDVNPFTASTSVETSPYTSDPEKLALLKQRGVKRVSIGIQSFIDAEVMAVGRSQSGSVVERALAAIKEAEFPVLNIDLMYGLPEQTPSSWLYSLQKTLDYRPQEIYLYPLYVRPLTGIGRKDARIENDLRISLYRQAREILIESGYSQLSMRMFTLEKGASDHQEYESGPSYSCQNDGMVGIGCGSRSYTSRLHYSGHYAVGTQQVRRILNDYIATENADFLTADYGIWLSDDEQKRRFVIQSLLHSDGLSMKAYQARFESVPQVDFADDFSRLIDRGLVEVLSERILLTKSGLEWSDRIGYDFYSSVVHTLMEDYEAS